MAGWPRPCLFDMCCLAPEDLYLVSTYLPTWPGAMLAPSTVHSLNTPFFIKKIKLCPKLYDSPLVYTKWRLLPALSETQNYLFSLLYPFNPHLFIYLFYLFLATAPKERERETTLVPPYIFDYLRCQLFGGHLEQRQGFVLSWDGVQESRQTLLWGCFSMTKWLARYLRPLVWLLSKL